MYKAFIIIFLICLVIIYLSNDCSVKEPFATTSPASYSPAEQDKVVQILKDTYEMEALFNIAQIAKGLQSTTGYTVPGDLNTSGNVQINGKLTVKGPIQIGDNITIKSDTNGDVITVGNGTTATNGKTRINIGKYSFVPNLSGGDNKDDYIELRYNKDGVATNEKLIGKFSKDAGDKAVIYTNDNSSNYFYVNNEPSLGMYNNTQGASGWIGNIKTQGVFTNDVKNLNGGFVIRGLDNSETKLCDGSTDCGKYIYVRNNENTSGFYKKTNEDTMFKIHSGDSRNTSIRNVGDNSEILNKDSKTRIRIKPDKTDICAGNNCDGKQFFVNYNNDNDNAVAGIRGDTNRTDLLIMNNKTHYKLLTNENNFNLRSAIDKVSIDANPYGGAAGDFNKVISFNNEYRGHHAWVNNNGDLGRWDESVNKSVKYN